MSSNIEDNTVNIISEIKVHSPILKRVLDTIRPSIDAAETTSLSFQLIDTFVRKFKETHCSPRKPLIISHGRDSQWIFYNMKRLGKGNKILVVVDKGYSSIMNQLLFYKMIGLTDNEIDSKITWVQFFNQTYTSGDDSITISELDYDMRCNIFSFPNGKFMVTAENNFKLKISRGARVFTMQFDKSNVPFVFSEYDSKKYVNSSSSVVLK